MTETLEQIAHAMVAPGKGILAADESGATIKKRFDAIDVENTEANRRDYREMLFGHRQAMTKYISGVILFDETIRQRAKNGSTLVDVIKASGAIPGIKVDAGAQPLAGRKGETITEGLDGLGKRLAEYHALGARFAKWRAVIAIADGLPTWPCVKANAHALARYGALCQEHGIVPIIEPEILMDGPTSTHDIARCAHVTEEVLGAVFNELSEAGVRLEGIILKPNMVVPGQKCPRQASRDEVASETLRILKRTVPPAVPGIAFLSGGQSDEDATAHLSLMNAMGPLPWKVTFSYGRALQAASLAAWRGKPENVPAAQKAFEHRAHMNSLASLGHWDAKHEAA